MPLWFVAVIFGCFAALAVGSIARAIRNGVASSFVRQYQIDENPAGYLLCLLSDAGIVVLGTAVVLYAFGLIGNPIDAINQFVPPFLRCSGGSCPP